MAFDTTDYQNQRFFPASVEDKLVGLMGRGAGVVLLGVIVFVWVSLVTWTTRDPSLTLATSGPVHNLGGAPGAVVADVLLQMLGFASVAVLLAPMFWGVELMLARRVLRFRSKIAFFPLSVLVIAGALSALPASAGWPIEHGYGGILGDFVFGLVAGFFAVINPARAAVATGLLLAAIGLSCLVHSIGLQIKDLYRILFQPLRQVNWRETAGSWQHSLLSEAKRLKDSVRDTLESEWPADKSNTRSDSRELEDASKDAYAPKIIVSGTTETHAHSEPRQKDAPSAGHLDHRIQPDAVQTDQPERLSRFWLRPAPASPSGMAAESDGYYPQSRDRISKPCPQHRQHQAWLDPLPPNPMMTDQMPNAGEQLTQKPAPTFQTDGAPKLPHTTPHPVSNPFDGHLDAQKNPSSIAAPPGSPAQNRVIDPTIRNGARLTQQHHHQDSIAEKFAAHVANEAGVEAVSSEEDDVALTSRAIARRFAPACAHVEPLTDPDIKASAPAAGATGPVPDTSSQHTVSLPGDAVPSQMKENASPLSKMRHVLPSTNLLARPQTQHARPDQNAEALRAKAENLQIVLGDFGVKGTVKNIRPGPVVTLYEFEPARGIKASRVIGLADDIARSMSAVSARVAVVPGRNVIGIELPNSERCPVILRALLDTNAYRGSSALLPLTLGKSIGGEPVVADLARMPHLLVAGTTGSGKSVGINTMVLSILFKHAPDTCRLLMIDPKMLELSVYNDIPHLLSPVITEPEKAVVALNWAVAEMEERYKKMSKLSVRNIGVYNNRIRNAKKRGERLSRTVHTGYDAAGQATYEKQSLEFEELPHIVIVVDEFADLMLVAGKEIEAAIQRLAQMARAAGIHLIMATQRPSVDVITGTIKANFPTRISFKVTSKVDSRTILNEQGAEQLLGQGDMLYASGTGQTLRVHGPFVSDEEVEAIADHLRAQGTPSYVSAVTEPPATPDEKANGTENAGQDIYDQALAIVLGDRKASTSYIQRRLSIGYNRAADLIERMEQERVISPAGRGGKREILLSSYPGDAA